MTVLEIARLFRHVREAEKPNTGQRVEAIQTWSGGKPGDSWCAHYVTMVLDLYYGGKSPMPRHGSCDVLLALARHQGWIVEHPLPGDLWFRLADPTDAVHVGFVTAPIRDGKFGQISGNTSEDGLSNNGNGVYERDVKYAPEKIAFAHLPEKP